MSSAGMVPSMLSVKEAYFSVGMLYNTVLYNHHKISADDIFYFFYFSRQIGVDISCKLSPNFKFVFLDE